MPIMLFFLAVLTLPWPAVYATEQKAAADVEACMARQRPLAEQAERFNGDPRMKRLIEADLRRASREAAEGDAEECLEALDHAAKLLAGDV